MLNENPAEVLGRKPAAPKPYECMGLRHDDADDDDDDYDDYDDCDGYDEYAYYDAYYDALLRPGGKMGANLRRRKCTFDYLAFL